MEGSVNRNFNEQSVFEYSNMQDPLGLVKEEKPQKKGFAFLYLYLIIAIMVGLYIYSFARNIKEGNSIIAVLMQAPAVIIPVIILLLSVHKKWGKFWHWSVRNKMAPANNFNAQIADLHQKNLQGENKLSVFKSEIEVVTYGQTESFGWGEIRIITLQKVKDYFRVTLMVGGRNVTFLEDIPTTELRAFNLAVGNKTKVMMTEQAYFTEIAQPAPAPQSGAPRNAQANPYEYENSAPVGEFDSSRMSAYEYGRRLQAGKPEAPYEYGRSFASNYAPNETPSSAADHKSVRTSVPEKKRDWAGFAMGAVCVVVGAVLTALSATDILPTPLFLGLFFLLGGIIPIIDSIGSKKAEKHVIPLVFGMIFTGVPIGFASIYMDGQNFKTIFDLFAYAPFSICFVMFIGLGIGIIIQTILKMIGIVKK